VREADTPPAAAADPTTYAASAPNPDGLPDSDRTTPARQQSQVVRTDYRTQYEGETVDKHALVYLPPGYDQ
jgi:hypothetical protein